MLFSLRTNSLKFRLMMSALLMILVMLPIIGITLNNAFDKQLKTSINNELKAYSYSILAVAEVENNALVMPELLLENQFNVIESGLYALINAKSSVANSFQKAKHTVDKSQISTLWQSPSLLTLSISENLTSPAVGKSNFKEVLIDDVPHLVYSFSVSFSAETQEFPVTLHIIKDQAQFLLLANEFTQQLWTWLIILMILFLVAQLFWLAWTLKPLRKLTEELVNIEQGKKNELQEKYPIELSQVKAQLNTLLQTEQNQRKRYRNALSDLAHSIKTPLSVMQSSKNLPEEVIEQLNSMNKMIEHQLIRAQSAGESSWHLGVQVQVVAENIIRSLAKIYQGKQITIASTFDEKAIFKGDEADLMEILGNVLDNAYKAAQSQVELEVKVVDDKLVIEISDDGSGIDDKQRQHILKRGSRADTYQKGHGIGLAIVRDLVESYHGKLVIADAKSLKGARFIITF